MIRKLSWCAVVVVLGCASPWKVSGGPKECVSMCRGWGMDLVGMVGVGNQDPTGAGATACVCELPGKRAAVSTGSSGIAAGTSAVIVAIHESEQQEKQKQQEKFQTFH